MSLAPKTRPTQKTAAEPHQPSKSSGSGYQQLTFRITGVSPLIRHNGQTADPLNPHSKRIAEITSKRKKTDADHWEIAHREFMAALYLTNGEPRIPGESMETALVEGAKKDRLGPQAKAGIIVEHNSPLEYDRPRKPEALWADERFRIRIPVKVGTAKIIRTRPKFENWSATIVVKFLSDLMNEEAVRSCMITAGEQLGICDWRPKFGRFNVE